MGVYLLMRAVQLAMLGNPVVTADTPMYRRAGQAWLDFGTTSLAGNSLRPWPITVLYSLAPTDTWRVILQFLIATCCWSFCIWQFGRLTSHRVVSLGLGLAGAGLAGSSGVSGFDAALLSESVTASMVALFVGGLVSVGSGRGRVPTMTVTFVTASILGILRPVLIPLVLGAVLVAGLALAANRGRTGPALVPALVLAMLGVGTVAYAWSYNVQVDKTWGDWMGVPGLNGRTLTQYYLAAYTTPSGPELIDAMVAAGAPACIRQRQAPAPAEPVDRVRIDREGCAEGQAWLSERYLSTLAGHLARHPTAAFKYFGDALDDASVVSVQNAAGEESVPSLVPGPVERLFFTRRQGSGLGPLLMWSAIAGAALAVCRRLEVAPSEFIGPPALRWPIGFALLAGYAALAGTALLSAADASRVALPVTVLLRLLLLAVVVRAAVALSARLRDDDRRSAA
ncbi:MAG: hypothetical protein Q8K72_19125 [Acidimicrobiales bacterium]|nr:hypothetical protein [Acidimicrobiales bacterium]